MAEHAVYRARARAYHWPHPSDPTLGACGMVALEGEPQEASTVPVEMRCQRPGCRHRWDAPSDDSKRCERCGGEMRRRPGQSRPRFAETRFCGRTCVQRGKPLKPGTIYRKRKVNGKSLLEHRVVMEEKLGRPLRPGEIVHHENEDKRDNRPENLEVTSTAEHSRHHNQKHPLTKSCALCGDEFTPAPTKRARQQTCSRECFRRLMSENARQQMAGKPAPNAKLSEEDVAEICRRRAAGESCRAIARDYGVHHGTVSDIVRGKSWAWARRAS